MGKEDGDDNGQLDPIVTGDSGTTHNGSGPTQAEIDSFDARESDRLLPIANITRIMKTALPDNAKIAKDAKECVQECVSEFIGFITSEGLHL
jgi:hypothetical protein